MTGQTTGAEYFTRAADSREALEGLAYPIPFERLPAETGGRWHLIAEHGGRRYHIGRAAYTRDLMDAAEPLPGVAYFLTDRRDSGLIHGGADAMRAALEGGL